MKIYQIRVNLKSRVEGVKLKPSYMVGVVMAKNQKEAEDCAILNFQKWIDKNGYEAYPQIGSVKPIPSSFVLKAPKK